VHQNERVHIPVLLAEVLEYIGLKEGGTYADLTFGEGGHTEELLRRGAARVDSCDRDGAALAHYREVGEFRADPRLVLHHTRFSDWAKQAPEGTYDGILIDLGVSTRQLLTPERGFSFAGSGPADMRMNPQEDESLLEKLKHISEKELARILEKNTDLYPSVPVARLIREAAHRGEIETTADLVKVLGGKGGKRHPATVIFLALRMWVNDELGEIEKTLNEAVRALKPGGRLVVITFHSTEDRQVKRGFRWLSGKCVCPPEARGCDCPKVALVKDVTKKPVDPSREEMRRNPRSRSAKLRIVEKL